MLLSVMSIQATLSPDQSNRRFFHTIHTTATPESIWNIWTDVPAWKAWDSGLRDASIDGEFCLGQSGTVISLEGRKSTFTITDYIAGSAYTFSTKLPLAALHVRRHLHVDGKETVFTHEVWFTGLAGGIFARLFGKKFRDMLPDVMEKVAQLALEESEMN